MKLLNFRYLALLVHLLLSVIIDAYVDVHTRLILLRDYKSNVLFDLPNKKTKGQDEIGGIFEYYGGSAISSPSDIVKLIKKFTSASEGRRTKSAKSTVKDRKKPVVLDDDDIDDLEKSVLKKYGSSKTEWDDDDDLEASPLSATKESVSQGFIPRNPKSSSGAPIVGADLQKKQLFREKLPTQNTAEAVAQMPQPRNNGKFSNKIANKFASEELTTTTKSKSSVISPSRAVYVDDLIQENELEGKSEFNNIDRRTQYDSNYDTKQDKSFQPTKKVQPQPSYRLRPPKPQSQEEIQLEAAKKAAIEEKAKEMKEKKAAKREEESSEYVPFTFDSPLNTPESDQIFTVASFSDIGIKNTVVLRNLERMKVYNPTKIQQLAIPVLMSGRDVVMQAQVCE